MNELLFASVVLPLILIVLEPFSHLKSVRSLLVSWASFPAFVLALFLPPSSTITEFPNLLLSMSIGLDEIGKAFLILTSGLWLIVGNAARDLMTEGERALKYRVFHLLALTGSLGTCIAQDAASFYTFFVIMTISSYGLIIHSGTSFADKAGRIYIRFSLVSEMLILSGLILAVCATREISFNGVAKGLETKALSPFVMFLLFLGFGVKVGVVSLHGWLPWAYTAAPIPVAAILSAAMAKAGILGWLRFLPLEANESWALVFMIAGVLMAFYGAVLSFVQVNVKTALAFSSLSQMGYLTIAIGTMFEPESSVPASLAACVAFSIHHAWAKTTLFLGVEVMARARDLVRRLIFLALTFTGLSLMGWPLTSGAYAKALLKESGSGVGWWHSISASFLLLGSSASSLAVARILVLLVRVPRYENSEEKSDQYMAPLLVAALFTIGGIWFLPQLLQVSGMSPSGTLNTASMSSLYTVLGSLVALLISMQLWLRKSSETILPPRVFPEWRDKLSRGLREFAKRWQIWFDEFEKEIANIRFERSVIRFLNRARGLEVNWQIGILAFLMVWSLLWVFLVTGAI